MVRKAVALLVACALMGIAPSAGAAVTSGASLTEEDDASLAAVSQIETTSADGVMSEATPTLIEMSAPDGFTSEASGAIAEMATLDGVTGATQDTTEATQVAGLITTPTEGLDAWVEDPQVEQTIAATTEAAVQESVETHTPVTLYQFKHSAETVQQLTQEWINQTLATYPEHTWAPLKFELDDGQLARLGLPSADILRAQRYPVPTMIDQAGKKEEVQLPALTGATGDMGPTVATVAGAGWFGIRPGSIVLMISGNSIGWCTLAHVYGSPGNYEISTAGHCGKAGQPATVVAAFGSRGDALHPILLDFGTFRSSTDGGLGNDKALISIDSQWQNLVTPTAIFWGGPRGIYTPVGSTAAVTIPRRGLIPSVSVNPDPTLAQVIVHYGHGTGIGTGGTPRAGTAIHWGTSHYMFEGVITFGDSGSYSNVIVGDTIGGSMEAAGINTHIWVDPLMRDGIGIMGGTRATQVSGTLANGQIVPYPAPVVGAP